jgi:hypothetical protein
MCSCGVQLLRDKDGIRPADRAGDDPDLKPIQIQRVHRGVKAGSPVESAGDSVSN